MINNNDFVRHVALPLSAAQCFHLGCDIFQHLLCENTFTAHEIGAQCRTNKPQAFQIFATGCYFSQLVKAQAFHFI